jgi:hypothetical protein
MQEHGGIALHLLPERFADRLEHGDRTALFAHAYMLRLHLRAVFPSLPSPSMDPMRCAGPPARTVSSDRRVGSVTVDRCHGLLGLRQTRARPPRAPHRPPRRPSANGSSSAPPSSNLPDSTRRSKRSSGSRSLPALDLAGRKYCCVVVLRVALATVRDDLEQGRAAARCARARRPCASSRERRTRRCRRNCRRSTPYPAPGPRRIRRRLPAHRRRVRVAVVLDDHDERRALDGGEIEALVEPAGRRAMPSPM